MTTGPAPAYLTIRSCGAAPCRPCLPSGRLSLDPSGTGGEAQGVVAEWAPGPLQLSPGLPHPAAKELCPQGASILARPSAGAGPSPGPPELCRAEVLHPTHQMRTQTQRRKDTGPGPHSVAPGQLSNQVAWTWALSVPGVDCVAPQSEPRTDTHTQMDDCLCPARSPKY